jgi:hypothetical protein
MMVVVKRGSGVDYTEKKDSPVPLTKSKIWGDTPDMTWKEIGAEHFDYPHQDEEKSRWRRDPEVDVYHDVEEFSWTVFHGV